VAGLLRCIDCDCVLAWRRAIQSIASGLTHGLLRAYWSIVGQELGLLFQLALVAVGLGAVVDKSILALR
jgi:homoserine/homoserine lactone efflux protein